MDWFIWLPVLDVQYLQTYVYISSDKDYFKLLQMDTSWSHEEYRKIIYIYFYIRFPIQRYINWVLIKVPKLQLHYLLDILTGGFMMSVIGLWVIMVTWYEKDTFEHVDLVYQCLAVSWCHFALFVMQFNTLVTELNQIMSQTHHKAHSVIRCTRQ